MIKFVRDDVDITARDSCRQTNTCDRSLYGLSTPCICSTVCSAIGGKLDAYELVLREIRCGYQRLRQLQADQ
jgi:hypothetical protein